MFRKVRVFPAPRVLSDMFNTYITGNQSQVTVVEQPLQRTHVSACDTEMYSQMLICHHMCTSYLVSLGFATIIILVEHRAIVLLSG